MAERPQAIAVAVVQRGESFLVGFRGTDQVLAGKAEFPGGKIDPGELPAQAAARECREETGLDVDILETWPVVDHVYPHGCLQLHFFLCRPRGDAVPRPPFRWVPRGELAALDFPAANAAVLGRLLA